MNDSEKPFACPSPGCNMSFTNEDHLTVHQKKHEMILNFGMNGKGNSFIADQTPTPTRFIRNCEEVGLFQDLQNVNPFEETFRRAVEAGKTGSMAISELGNADDTLHTPHIFPHIVDCSPANQVLPHTMISLPSTITVTETSNENCSTETKICSSMEVSRNNSNEEEVVNKLKITNTCTNIIQTTETVVVQESETWAMPKNPVVQTPTHLSINGEEVQLLLKTSDGKLLQLSAAPALECQSNISKTNLQRVVSRTEPPLRCANEWNQDISKSSKLSFAKMKLKQALTKSKARSANETVVKEPEKVKESSPSKENRRKRIDQCKKQELQERNRASSMRARAKRKVYIQQLEKTVKNVNEKNAALQTEVEALRSEVLKLKSFLLAHKECPVTKAMEKGNSIYVGPQVLSVNPYIAPDVTLSNDVTRKRTSFSNAVPGASKKLCLSTGKNPLILPKSDNHIGGVFSRSEVAKNLPALQIKLGSIQPESEREKQVLIIPSFPLIVGEPISENIEVLSNLSTTAT